MKAIYCYGEISIPQAKAKLTNGISLNNDIFIIENITTENLPTNSKEVKCLMMIFCEEGKIRYEIDNHTVTAEKNDIILCTIGQKVTNFQVLSSTFHGKAILMEADYLPLLTNHINDTLLIKKKLRDTDTIKLNPQEMQNTNVFFSQIMAFITQTGYNNRLQLAINLILILFQMALDKAVSMETKKRPKDLIIYEEFVNLVEEFVMQQKPISFYTKKLNISRSSLEGIVRKYSNSKPQKHIHQCLIKRICIIAECTSKEKFPIKKIAEYAHFKSTSALARFVKRHINMSLSEYCRKVSAGQLHTIQNTILDRNAALKDLPRIYIREDLIPHLS